MKICCVIDSLNFGGAQRQMTCLVRALVESHHQVRLLTYHHYDHYLPDIVAYGIQPENISSSSKVGRFWNVRSAIRRDLPNVVITFLDTPNLLGVFSCLPPRRIPLIVSERNHDINGINWKNRIRFNAFRAATRVVTNCYSQADFVANHFPFLKSKLTTILNCVDLERFCPLDSDEERIGGTPLKLIVAASVIPRKNTASFIRGVAKAKQESRPVSVDWYGSGRPTKESEYYLRCKSLISELGLESDFRFHDPVRNIEDKIRTYDGCCLPSLREGCPNFVCEALSSGVPVLVSDHGDMKRMVNDSLGFRFDPHSVDSIANGLIRFASLSQMERKQIGARCRRYAEASLGPQRFSEQYESIIRQAVK